MDIKMIEKLIDKLADELEQISRKTGTMSTAELDSINKLIVSIEKLMKIEEIQGGAYSQGNGYTYTNGYGNNGSYGNGTSYGNNVVRSAPYMNGSYGNGEHWVTGHYSRDDGSEMMKEQMKRMLNDNNISGTDRRTLERAMELLG